MAKGFALTAVCKFEKQAGSVEKEVHLQMPSIILCKL